MKSSMKKCSCLPLILTLLLGALLNANFAQALQVRDEQQNISSDIEYMVDPSGQVTLEDLLARPSRYEFKSSRDSKPESWNVATWLKIRLDFTEATRNQRYYLISRAENIQEIKLYRPQQEGGYYEKVTGNRYPAASRELASHRYGFLIEPRDQGMTVYIRYIGGPGSNNFPWVLIEAQNYAEHSREHHLFDVATLSAMLALLLFNISIALSLRKPEYVSYCGYIACVILALITLDGLGFYYLWPEFPALNDRALHSFNLLSAAMRLITILWFLGVASFAPRLHQLALGLLLLMGITLVAVNVVGISNLPAFTAPVPWILGILYGFVICGYAVYKRIRLAIPLFIALLVPSMAAIVQAMLIVNNPEPSALDLQVAKIGFVVHIILFSFCLAARLKLEIETKIDALHDGLTGLPGTQILQERFDLAAALLKREGKQMAVLFIDLDGFKAVNDGLGHAAGDQLLAQIAKRLQKLLRRTDTVARIGGDEFVVMLTQLDEESDALAVAEKILAAVAKPCLLDGNEASVQASIGVAMYPEEGQDLESLLKLSDAAMYQSKQNGKNCCSTSSDTIADTGATAAAPIRLGTATC